MEIHTALVTGSYLVGKDPSGSDRTARIAKFLGYYLPLSKYLGFDQIYLLDNGSPRDLIKPFQARATFLRYPENIGPRGQGLFDYPYCWRMLYGIRILIELGYEKIIFIDSDCYVLNNKVTDFMKDVQTGWNAFQVKRYRFPSAECWVLCKDSFSVLHSFTSHPIERHYGNLMETTLPFTQVHDCFNVDRWGEDSAPVTHDMDIYGNAPTHVPFHFEHLKY